MLFSQQLSNKKMLLSENIIARLHC